MVNLDRPVRVRFAPSPTGGLHIGGVRTALYNYVFAKKHQGKFLIRVEDTDQTRFVEGAESYIFDALRWLGLNADESPEVGGTFSPYRQSERKTMYRQYAEQLVASGNAYYAFDTSEELDLMRKNLEASGSKNPSYNALTRVNMTNSLTLSPEETQKKIDAGEHYVIRIKMPKKDDIRFEDIVRGWVNVHSSTLDDKVLMKSDGMPTYHLANVVDDYLMEISHVIRGEEWLPSAPLHVFLYQSFGWADKMPQFAHLPLLLNPDGQGKLSKRKAAEYGFPIFPLDWFEKDKNITIDGFREKGYLPEALNNFLALLGWHTSSDEEIFTIERLIEVFDLERIGKAGVRFEIKKAEWFNQHYIRLKSNEDLLQYLKETFVKLHIKNDFSDEKLLKICSLMRERITFPQDIYLDAKYLFELPTEYDQKGVAKNWQGEGLLFVDFCEKNLPTLQQNWEGENIKHYLHEWVEQNGYKMGKVMPALRLAISGASGGADLGMIMELIGYENVMERISIAKKNIVVG
ncbi:MAG: glutamate--tRNA ligase [Bacteroidetes bacterium]|nr:MAG: glutamate--tRNA ligase [Bacteroidota bacterium]TAG86036.1 MAG: glutamate--tRNA ligase [Bacteroidota bacterium]